jgi:hypothetical protein
MSETDSPTAGTRGIVREGKIRRRMDGVTRNMVKRRLTEGDTRDRDRWRTLVLGEGNHLCNGMNEYVSYMSEWYFFIFT